MASLTTGTANFGDDVFFNDTALMSEFYQRMQNKGVRPEFEIFEAGQIDNALKLVKKYGPAGPLMHWDFVLGVPGSMSGEPRNLAFLVDRVPPGSTWTCTGIGRWHMPVTMTALALGGNVRLGFEDNIFLHKGVLAEGERRARWPRRPAGRRVGPACATPDEARRILKTRAVRQVSRSRSDRRARLGRVGAPRGRRRAEAAAAGRRSRTRSVDRPDNANRRGRAREPEFSGPTGGTIGGLTWQSVRDGGSRRRGGHSLGIFSKERPNDPGSDGLLASLVQLGNLLRSSPDLSGVVRSIATGAARTFGFNEVTVYLSAPGDDLFRAARRRGPRRGARPGHPRHACARPAPSPPSCSSATRSAARSSSTTASMSTRPTSAPCSRPPSRVPARPASARPPAGSAGDKLLVPLRDRANRMIGVLDLADPADHGLPTLDLAKELEVFATFAAAAVESARQYEELERTTDLLEQQLKVRHELLDVSGALLSTLDHTAVFVQIADVLKMLVDYDTIDIALVDETANELVTIFAQDKWANEMLRFRQPLDQGVGGWVVRHDEPQLVNDMTHDPRGVLVPGTDLEPQASVLVPLRFMGAVIGLLAVDRLAGRTFEERELEIVQLFANLAAIAIRNARSYKEMEVQASTDGLTGLFNHRRFQEALALEVARAERYDTEFCLLMMDLDRFKAVNDTVGHQRGDEVLRDVADVLRRCSRESDFAARYGGEEFAMILPHADIDEARQVAERVRGQVADLSAVEPGLQVTMSVGIASFPHHASDTDGILGAADAALLSAKARGRNCVYTSVTTSPRGFAGQTPLAGLGRRFAPRAGFSAGRGRRSCGGPAGARDRRRRRRPDGRGSPSGASRAQAPRSTTWSRRCSTAPNAGTAPATRRVCEASRSRGWRGRSPSCAPTLTGRRRGAALRAEAGRRFDPRMVNRFLAFLGEEASHWNPLDGIAEGRA